MERWLTYGTLSQEDKMRYPGTNGENIDFIVKDIIMSSSSGADLDWRVLWCGKRPYGADLHFPSFASLRRKWACVNPTRSRLYPKTCFFCCRLQLLVFCCAGKITDCQNFDRTRLC